MTRLIHRRVHVTEWHPQGYPAAFFDRQHEKRVAQRLSSWTETGRWWEGETPSAMHRLLTTDGAIVDLDCSGADVFLYRIWD